MPLFFFQSKRLACFADIGKARSQTGLHFPVLDGARAIAALLVLCQHVFYARPVYGVGGVFLFFVLSGLLLSQHWYGQHTNYGWRFTLRFLLRRILRVIPMYVAALLIIALVLPRDGHWLQMHLTFQWSEYTLWTIKQELLFYLILPLLMLPRYFGIPAGTMCILSLLTAAIASQTLGSDVLDVGSSYIEYQVRVPFFMASFCVGVAAGSFINSRLAPAITSRMSGIPPELSMLAILLSIGMMYHYHPMWLSESSETWEYHLQWALLIGLFLLHLLLRPDRVVARLLSSRPLMAIGIVGYSHYLLHWPILILMKPYTGHGTYQTLLLAALVTYVLSCVTYCLIEKPYMNLLKK